MKILKDGKIPEPEKPWWVHRVHKCTNCRAELQFEEGDRVAEQATRMPNGKRWVVFTCPFCLHSQELVEVIYRK